MSEYMLRSSAPDPLKISAASEISAPITTEAGWDEYNADVGRLVNQYIGQKYVLDGKEYTVWFAKPAGGINEGKRYISEFDLMGQDGDFIEGITAKDLAERIEHNQQLEVAVCIHDELNLFDERFGPDSDQERLAFEVFLRQHPKLTDDDPTLSDDFQSATEHLATDKDSVVDFIEKIKSDELNRFDEIAAQSPEFEGMRDEFIKDLELYLEDVEQESVT